MKVGILARIDKPQAAELAASLSAALSSRGVEVLLERRTASLLGETAGHTEEELSQSCNLFVA
ncbi:MAG: hypothetical protein ACKO39_15290, partial [Chthoniobacterales bacterium]